MTTTNTDSGTRIDEVEGGIFKIHTPFGGVPGGFSFNQYLVVDDEPLLFHTGPRQMFPLVHQAIAHVLPVEKLRWISFSHFEADECGALNQLLAAGSNRAHSHVCTVQRFAATARNCCARLATRSPGESSRMGGR